MCTKQLQIGISCTIVGIVLGFSTAAHGFASVKIEEQICVRKSRSKEEERKRKRKRTRKGKGKGGEGERTGGKGLSVIWGYCLNKWVSLSSRQVVPLIVPLASMQLCMKQLLLRTYRYHLWGGAIATLPLHSV